MGQDLFLRWSEAKSYVFLTILSTNTSLRSPIMGLFCASGNVYVLGRALLVVQLVLDCSLILQDFLL